MKHILLCLAGMTPQIITETCWALYQKRGEQIDEIRVITTLEGLAKAISRIRKKLEDTGIPRQYTISSQEKQGTARYQITIGSERIIWR